MTKLILDKSYFYVQILNIMQLIIRTNASNKVGLGHLTRSLSYANILKKKKNCKIFIDEENRKLTQKFKNFNINYLYKKMKNLKMNLQMQ